MPLRRVVVAALAMLALAPILPAAANFGSSDSTPGWKRLPGPERTPVSEDGAHDPRTLLVRFERGASAAAQAGVLKSAGATVVGAVAGTGFVQVRTGREAAEVAPGLERDPSVDAVSLDYRRHVTRTPNDPAYTGGYQTYLNTVRLPQAWDLVRVATTQVIAVVDTGVDTTHPDLAYRTVPGYNAVSPGSPPTDYDPRYYPVGGHGTMVAGIAAANTDNGTGIAGAAWTGAIMPIKVFGPGGYALDSDVAEGMAWAVSHGAKIVNLSLGGSQPSPVLEEAVRSAKAGGAVIVAAAGNQGNDTAQYPAAYPDVLAVSATDEKGALTDFSSWGNWVDLAAPGFNIVATYIPGYAIGHGTSFAAPIASGVAALVRARYPSLSPDDVISRLRDTARDAGPRGIDPFYGYGVLDAFNAVGGTWGTEFAQRLLGSEEPNDVPARATAVSGSVTGTIGIEGDVDWYRYDSDAQKQVSITLTPPPSDDMLPYSVDPVVAVYDSELRPLARVDRRGYGEAETFDLTLAAGRHYIAVRSVSGAADPRTYTLTVGPGSGAAFGPAASIPLGTSAARSTAVGDVTGDGRADVLVATVPGYYGADPGHDYRLVVFAQQADGTLGAPVPYPTGMQAGDQAGGLAVLDADGDGRLDAALATQAGVEIFLQTGAGVLADGGVLPGTAGASRLVAADMDADHDTDLVTSGGSLGTVLLTHETGAAFTPSPVAAQSQREVETGDVDGDGRADIVGFDGGTVRVYHRTDTGWTRTDHATVSDYPRSIAGIEVADVSGDARADIVATLAGSGAQVPVDVFVQSAGGALAAPDVYTVPNSPQPVEAADVNGDARGDVVIGHGSWYGTLSVLPQKSDGKLGAPVVAAIPPTPLDVQGMTVADVTNDGRADAVIASALDGLVVLHNAWGPVPAHEQVTVRNVAPADFATGVAVTSTPEVGFQRSLDPASVTGDTVALLHGRTGARLSVTLGYDDATKTVRMTPAAPLRDNTPYRIVVGAVRDQAGAVHPGTFSTTFRTVNLPPPAVGAFKATGAYTAATLTWTLPGITDLDKVIVRMAAGTTPPSSPTSGIGVYAGTGTSVRVTGLASGTTYSFRAWVRDRTGALSAAAGTQLLGTGLALAAQPTAVAFGGTVSLTGRLVRRDTGAAVPGAPVQLYYRRKGIATWTLLATVTSSSTGTISFAHKPGWNVEYVGRYNGSTAYMGALSNLVAVGVRPVVTAALSKTSFALGGSVVLSGSVTPNHAGQTVYLQRLVSGSWTTITSRTLSSTSTYGVTIKPSVRGTYYYRVYKPADGDHLAATSPTRSFSVT